MNSKFVLLFAGLVVCQFYNVDAEHSKLKIPTGSSKDAHVVKIVSPIVGLVEDLVVKVGDKVKEGQPLFNVSVAKMSIEIKAPVAGVVKSIDIANNVEVKDNDVVLTIKPAH